MKTLDSLQFRHATSQNTKAYILDINEHRLYISYETVVGYSGPFGNFRLRNTWGPTTGKHMAKMGLKGFGFDEIGKEYMELLLDNLFEPRDPKKI